MRGPVLPGECIAAVRALPNPVTSHLTLSAVAHSNSDPYIKACALVCSYRAAFPELAPECLLQELLARGPKWFGNWWADLPAGKRANWISDSGLLKR
jgi:hypothetical protein